MNCTRQHNSKLLFLTEDPANELTGRKSIASHQLRHIFIYNNNRKFHVYSP